MSSVSEKLVEISRSSSQEVFGIELVFDQTGDKGLHVGGLATDSPASRTALRKGDRILKVNDVVVGDDLRAAVAVFAQSTQVTLTYSSPLGETPSSSSPRFSVGSLVDVRVHGQWRTARVRSHEGGVCVVDLVIGLREASLQFPEGDSDLQPLHTHTTALSLGDENAIFESSMRIAREISASLTQPPPAETGSEPSQPKEWHSADHRRLRDFIRLNIADIILKQARQRTPEQLERMAEVSEKLLYERADSLVEYSNVSTLPDRLMCMAREMLQRKTGVACPSSSPESQQTPRKRTAPKVVEVISLISDDEDDKQPSKKTSHSKFDAEDIDLKDVAILSAPVDCEVEVVPKKRTKTEESHDTDTEIEFVGGSFACTSSMPHQREACSMFPFKFSSSAANNMHCDFCYCYICDTKAAECVSWTNDHCHASTKNPLSKKERELFHSPLFKSLTRRAVKDFWTFNKEKLVCVHRCFNRMMMEQLVRQFLRRVDEILRSKHTLTSLIEAAALLLYVQKHCQDISDELRQTVDKDLFDVICSPTFTVDCRRSIILELESLHATTMSFNPIFKIFPLDLLKALCDFDPEFSWVQTRREIPLSSLLKVSKGGLTILEAKLKSLRNEGGVFSSIDDNAAGQVDFIINKILLADPDTLPGAILSLHSISESLWKMLLVKLKVKLTTPVDIVRFMASIFQLNTPTAGTRIKVLMETQYLQLQNCESWTMLEWNSDDIRYVSAILSKETAILSVQSISTTSTLLKVAVALFSHTVKPFSSAYCKRFVSNVVLLSAPEERASLMLILAVVEYLHLTQPKSHESANLYLELMRSSIENRWVPGICDELILSRLFHYFRTLFRKPERLFDCSEAKAICECFYTWASSRENFTLLVEPLFIALWIDFHTKHAITSPVSRIRKNYFRGAGDILYSLVSKTPQFSDSFVFTPTKLDCNKQLWILYRLRNLQSSTSNPVVHAKELSEWKNWVQSFSPQSWDFWLGVLKSTPLTTLECLALGDLEQVPYLQDLMTELLLWDSLKTLWNATDVIFTRSLLARIIQSTEYEENRPSIDKLSSSTSFFDDMYKIHPKDVVRVAILTFSVPLLSKFLKHYVTTDPIGMDSIKEEFSRNLGYMRMKLMSNQLLSKAVIIACMLGLYDIASQAFISSKNLQFSLSFLQQILSSVSSVDNLGPLVAVLAPKAGSCYWSGQEYLLGDRINYAKYVKLLDSTLKEFLQRINSPAAEGIEFIELLCYSSRSINSIREFMNHSDSTDGHRDRMKTWLRNADKALLLSPEVSIRFAAEYGNRMDIVHAISCLPSLNAAEQNSDIASLCLRCSFDYCMYSDLLLNNLFTELRKLKHNPKFLRNFFRGIQEYFPILLSSKELTLKIDDTKTEISGVTFKALIHLFVLMCDCRQFDDDAVVEFLRMISDYSVQNGFSFGVSSLFTLMADESVDVSAITDVLTMLPSCPIRGKLSIESITAFLAHQSQRIAVSRLEKLLANVIIDIVAYHGLQSMGDESEAYDISSSLEHLVDRIQTVIVDLVATGNRDSLLALLRASRQFNLGTLTEIRGLLRTDSSELISQSASALLTRWIECEGGALFKIMIFKRVIDAKDEGGFSREDVIKCLTHGVAKLTSSLEVIHFQNILDAVSHSPATMTTLKKLIAEDPNSHDVLLQLCSHLFIIGEEFNQHLFPLIDFLSERSDSPHLLFMYRYSLREVKFTEAWDAKPLLSRAKWETLLDNLVTLHINKRIEIPFQELYLPLENMNLQECGDSELSSLNRLKKNFLVNKEKIFKSVSTMSQEDILNWTRRPRSNIIFVVVNSLITAEGSPSYATSPIHALSHCKNLEQTWKILARSNATGFIDALLNLAKNVMDCILHLRQVVAKRKDEFLAFMMVVKRVLLEYPNDNNLWPLLLSQAKATFGQKKPIFNLIKNL